MKYFKIFRFLIPIAGLFQILSEKRHNEKIIKLVIIEYLIFFILKLSYIKN
jgi:hypothetical protein